MEIVNIIMADQNCLAVLWCHRHPLHHLPLAHQVASVQEHVLIASSAILQRTQLSFLYVTQLCTDKVSVDDSLLWPVLLSHLDAFQPEIVTLFCQ